MNKCVNCGAEIHELWSECPACGVPHGPAEPQEQRGPDRAVEPSPPWPGHGSHILLRVIFRRPLWTCLVTYALCAGIVLPGKPVRYEPLPGWRILSLDILVLVCGAAWLKGMYTVTQKRGGGAGCGSGMLAFFLYLPMLMVSILAAMEWIWKYAQ